MEARRDIFQAIADPTRREIITLVARSPQNLNSIAEGFHMSRQAISLHVRILEECGVLSVRKEGRERLCSLNPKKLEEVAAWVAPFRKMWENRFNQLDNVLANLKSKRK